MASGVDKVLEDLSREIPMRVDLLMAALKNMLASYVITGTLGLPNGGTAGQLLKKNSSTDGDATFATINPIDIGAADQSHTHVHTHVIADVTGLQTALDGKAAITSIPASFRKVKAADQSLASNTALADITDLSFAMAAGETWDFDAVILYDATITGDIQFAVNAPAGATLVNASITGYGAGITGGSYNATNKHEPLTALNTGVIVGGNNAGFLTPCLLRGTVVNPTNAGNLVLRFAQGTSDATASIVKANSMLWGVRST